MTSVLPAPAARRDTERTSAHGPGGAPAHGSQAPASVTTYLSVLLVGAVAFFAFLGRASLSLDETVSATIAKSTWRQFAHTVTHREANMVLYYAVLRAWAHLGHGEAVLRSVSVIASLAALALVVALASDLFGRRVALVCGLLMAVDPIVVQFAQEARGYALSLMLVTGSSLLFARAMKPGSGRSVWVGYVALSALAAYTNFWAALVPLGHAASLGFVDPGRVRWRRVVVSALGLAVLLVPLGLLIRSTDSSGVNWAAGSTGGRLFTKVRGDVPHPLIDLAVVLAVIVVLVLLVRLRRSPRASRLFEKWPVSFVLCWLLVPPAAVVALSLVYKPLIVVRYLLVCIPPVAILVAMGLVRLGRRLLTAGLVLLVAVSGVGLWAFYDHGTTEDWRGAVSYVAADARPGDGVIVFAPYMRVPFEWYLPRHPALERSARPVFPTGGWEVDTLRFDSYIPVNQAAVAKDASGYHRVWLVLCQWTLYPSEYQELLAALRSDHFVATRSRTFAGIQVVGFARSAVSTT
jgi:mannosyltransferase